jgi:hypothetical protein
MKEGRPEKRLTSHQTSIAAARDRRTVHSSDLELEIGLRTRFRSINSLRSLQQDAPKGDSQRGRIMSSHRRWSCLKKIPENKVVSGASPANQTRTGLIVTFFYPDYNRRLWSSHLQQWICCNGCVTKSCTCVLVGFTTGRVLHPAPKEYYSILGDYTAS